MIRANDNVALIKHLSGVREVGDDPNNILNEIHGMCDSPATSLSRLDGKVLACSGALGGPVWSLHQCRFRDRSFLFKRVGTEVSVADEMAPIVGLRFPDPEIPLDDGTFTNNPSRPSASSQDPADWPESYVPAIQEPDNNSEQRNQPAGSWPGGREDDRSITTIPSQVIIRSYGSNPYTAEFNIKKSDSSSLGIDRIRCTWPDSSWLYLRHHWGRGYENLVSNSLFLLGFWSAWDSDDLEMTANVEPDVVYGIHQQTVTFQVTDAWGRPFERNDGSYITATLLVIYMSGAPEIEVVTVPPIIIELVGNDLVAVADQTIQFRNIGAGWLYWSFNLVNNPPPDWLDGLALTSNTPTVVQGPMVNGETKDVTIGLVNSLDISVTRPLSPFRSNAIIRGYADASGVDLLQTESVEIQLHVRRPPYIWLDATRAGEAGWVSDSLSESSHVPLELFDELLQKPGHVSDSIECRIYNGINAVGYISEWPLNYEIPIWTKTHPGGAILPVTDLRVSLPDYPLQPLPGSNYSYGTVPAGVPYANFDRVKVEMFKMFELSIPYSTVLNPYYEIPYIEVRDTENRTPTQHLHICVQRFPACTDTLKVDMVFTSYDPNHHFLMTANWIDVGGGVYAWFASQWHLAFQARFWLYGRDRFANVRAANNVWPCGGSYTYLSAEGDHENTAWTVPEGLPSGSAEWNNTDFGYFQAYASWGPGVW